MEKILNYINGRLIGPTSKRTIPNYDPATGQVYSTIPDSDDRDIQKAYTAAEKAFPAWSKLAVQERAAYLEKIARAIHNHLKEFARAESRDNGKPVWLATEVDIPRAVSNFRFFARAITQFGSESYSMPGQAINYTLRQPLGVVGCISPWNLPLYLFTWKIAPALAAGNTVVAKPSEVTPMTAYLLSKICKECGLPKGVLNIVHGFGHKAGDAMTIHPGIKAISFTGGTRTGSIIASKAAPMFKKLSLELGGKNPNIIFADAQYDKMLSTTMRSSFANQGQICLCGSRILVEEKLYPKFRSDFVKRTKNLVVGDPKTKVDLGAVVSEAHMNKILGKIETAVEEGGRILAGGKRIKMSGRCREGWFVEPTIIEGLPSDCSTNREEIFGPVVTIMPFKTEDEVLNYANSVQYGLSSTIWTQDIDRAHRIAEKIEAGIVWINCWLLRDLRTPFGGVKHSGVGREGGFEVLRFFTEPKNVCIKYT